MMKPSGQEYSHGDQTIFFLSTNSTHKNRIASSVDCADLGALTVSSDYLIFWY